MSNYKTIESDLKRAVAIFYDGEHNPVVLAKGTHEVADEIVQTANEYDIPIYDNVGLSEVLNELDIGDEIPKELYQAVASILAFAYEVSLSGDMESQS
ncbi:MAG: flagellar biosynthesis protein [Flavobacteriales bacterium]|jgi:flagellar biosynthesis protein